MSALRPFFTYYGGKYRAAPRYPEPRYDTIIEPFAGSAGYSVRHHRKKVLIYDASEEVVGTWQYLIGARPDELLALPDLAEGQTVEDLAVPQEARWLIGWWLNKGTSRPATRPSAWMRSLSGAEGENVWGPGVRIRLARQVPEIRHWRAEVADYATLDRDVPATWFVDPPYAGAPGGHYPHGAKGIDYVRLGAWCRSLNGQVIVCEASGADWLPFQHLANIKATAGRGRTGVSAEAVWINNATTLEDVV